MKPTKLSDVVTPQEFEQAAIGSSEKTRALHATFMKEWGGIVDGISEFIAEVTGDNYSTIHASIVATLATLDKAIAAKSKQGESAEAASK